MKQMRRKLSFLLIAVLLLGMNVRVQATQTDQQQQAANKPHTITILGEGTGHTYEAYQVFSGRVDTVSGESVLSDIQWGKGINTSKVNGKELLEDLQTCTLAGINGAVDTPFAGCKTAAEVAEKLAGTGNDSDLVELFSRVVAGHLSTDFVTSTEQAGGPNTEGKYTYTIPVTGDGYYFIKDKDGSVTAEGESYTKYMLQVIGDVEVNAKADTPSLDKEIVEDEPMCGNTQPDHEHTQDCYETDRNNAAVGDVVNYKVTSNVPVMDGYENYFFVVTDTMSKGLTFNNDVAIVITGPTITAKTLTAEDFTVTTSAGVNGSTEFKIVFKNFIQYKALAGADIEIRYSATLNEDADMGTTGNKNTAKLTYSNNPQVSTDGDEPSPDSPVGETPEEETYTYTTEIELTKVDGEGNRLEGAEFEISGTKMNTVVVRKEVFSPANPQDVERYYELIDGSYTTTMPTVETAASYAGITGATTEEDVNKVQVYRKDIQTEVVTSIATDADGNPIPVTARAVVSENGVLRFEGLAAGEYTITEITAPNGFNLLDKPLKINITWQEDPNDLTKCIWDKTVDSDSGFQVGDDGIFRINVVNQSGTTLPSTGGMGTTIFYVVGTILVLGAAIVLIAKKRTSIEK